MNLNIKDFWQKDHIERKGFIFTLGIEERTKESLAFLREKCCNYELLKLAIEFIDNHYSDAIKSTIEQYSTIGYVPTIEAEMELDYAIKHALIGSYKASFSDLRRAIELSLLGVHFVNGTNIEKSMKWFRGNMNTPFFGTITKELIKEGRFKDFNNDCSWLENLKITYYKLSDYTHNKGRKCGYQDMNSIRAHISGTTAPSIKTDTLEILCNLYIETVQEIVVILILYNPIILIGLPMEEKFGINGPMSGFYNEGQSELIRKLIPERYKKYFENLAESDSEINKLKEWIISMPDISEVELGVQIENFHKSLSNTN